MKIKRWLSLVIVCAFMTTVLCGASGSYNGRVRVYVTDTGECYHRLGCSYLISQNEMRLKDAVENGYRACSRCNPPRFGYPNEHDTDRYYTYEERRAMEEEKARKEQEAEERAEKEAEWAQKKAEEARKAQAEEERRLMTEKYAPVLYIGITVVVFVLLLWIIDAMRKRKREMALHEARCRGDLPGGMPGMPFGTIIGEDGLPKQIRAKSGWGPLYTFYVSRTGNAFHKSPQCTRGAYLPIHAALIGGRIPCRKCRPVKPDISWYLYGQSAWKEEKSEEKVLQLPESKADCGSTIPSESPQKVQTNDPDSIIDSGDLHMPEYWLNIEISGRTVLVYADDPVQLSERIKELEEAEEKKREEAIKNQHR